MSGSAAPPGPYLLEPQLVELSRRLRRATWALGMRDAKDIAAASGLTAKTVRKYLMGTSLPNSVALLRLSRALGVTPGWLLGNTMRDESRTLVSMMVGPRATARGPAVDVTDSAASRGEGRPRLRGDGTEGAGDVGA